MLDRGGNRTTTVAWAQAVAAAVEEVPAVTAPLIAAALSERERGVAAVVAAAMME